MDIRAIGPDNVGAVNDLVRLYTKVYGRRFPVKAVYDASYWRSSISSRLTTLVCKQGDRLVASLSFATDRFDPRHVHLIHPVCHPDFTEDMSWLENSFTPAVERMLKQRKWQVMHLSSFAEIEQTHQLLPALRCHEVAVFPAYYRTSGLNVLTSGPRASRDKSARLPLMAAARIIQPDSSVSIRYYPPEQHRSIISRLYEPLGLSRSENSGASHASMCADARAVEKRYFRESGIYYYFIQPSLASQKDLRSISDAKSRAQAIYVMVDLFDPVCPSKCNELEEAGFRFCGITPHYRGRDSLVYFWSPASVVDSDLPATPRYQMIAKYIDDPKVDPATLDSAEAFVKDRMAPAANRAGNAIMV